MPKYTLDIEKLKEVTGLSQKEIATELNVSETVITQAKSVGLEKWGLTKNYMEKFNTRLPIEEFIKEVKE